MQSGLSGLQLGAEASIDELRDGIGVMISGAAVAFLTSVWGVFLSLVFNFLDKIADRRKRTKIILLQAQIDQIFPRITPEEQLLKIASDGEESREVLQGLAEKIGDELQKTMSTVSSDITSSLEEALNNIMAPAISQLVNQSTQSGNAALESLITRFMDGIGEQGAQQREALTKTTDQMNSSMASFGDNLNSLVSSLEDNQNLAKERDDLVIQQMSDASQKMAGSVSSEISTLGKTVADSMSGIFDATEQSTTAVQQKISEQLDAVTKSINESMSHSQQQSIDSIKVMTESIQSQVTDIKEAVATSMEKLTDSSLSAVQAVQASMTEQLDKVVKSENAHIDKMAEHSTLISSTANELLESVKNTVEENLGVAGQLIHQAEELQKAVKANVDSQMDMSGKMLDASNKIMVTSENMKGYGEQFERANTALSRALKESAESTTELSEQNKETLRQVTQLQQQLVDDYQRYRDVQNALEQTVGLADCTFEKMRQHQEEYAKLLKSNVDSLAEQMTGLLRQFASEAQEQTSDRLNHWNHQTAEYTTTMNGAIQALAGVVDEMEGKLQ